LAKVSTASASRISAAALVLQARVAADLGGDGALASAELDERVDEPALDQDEDHQRDVEGDLVEVVDVVGVRRPARQRGEESEQGMMQSAHGGGDSIQARTGKA
jgi:hypothetical protein